MGARRPKLEACAQCGTFIDPLRERARVINGRVASICARCDGAEQPRAEQAEILAVTCPESRRGTCACGARIDLHSARPMAHSTGAIVLRCDDCVRNSDTAREGGDAVDDDAVDAVDDGARGRRWGRYVIAAAALATLVGGGLYSRAGGVPMSVAARGALEPGDVSAAAERAEDGAEATAEVEVAEVETASEPEPWELEPTPTIEDLLEQGEQPLDAMLPTLADWIHPVPGSTELYPRRRGRAFGAPRDGVDRKECGRGHCGVDLNGPRGQPIVAVAWGIVVRVEHRSDRRSGKYVKIQHPDYVYTSYMHLDEIAPGIETGAEIQAGDVVGTLGRTGILRSAPHLHFALEVPRDSSEYATRYVDPAPYLARATVSELFSYSRWLDEHGVSPRTRRRARVDDDRARELRRQSEARSHDHDVDADAADTGDGELPADDDDDSAEPGADADKVDDAKPAASGREVPDLVLVPAPAPASPPTAALTARPAGARPAPGPADGAQAPSR